MADTTIVSSGTLPVGLPLPTIQEFFVHAVFPDSFIISIPVNIVVMWIVLTRESVTAGVSGRVDKRN